MRTHLHSIHATAGILLLGLFAMPVRADILYMANTDYGQPFGANYIDKYTTDPVSGGLFANLSGVGSPLGLAFDGDANLYVANNSGGTIMKYTPDGAGSVFASGIDSAIGLAFDRAGSLFVSTSLGIMKVTPDGIGSVFATGVGAIGIAFDSADNLYAADNSGGRILQFTPEGGSSVFASGLSAPEGLAFDRAGNLFVVNIGNRTISTFTPGGVGSVFASSGLVNPVGLAFDSAGNLFVGDADGIKKFTPDGVGSVFINAPYANGYPTFLAFTDDAGVPLALANQIPEPSLGMLFGLGLAGLLAFRQSKVLVLSRAR